MTKPTPDGGHSIDKLLEDRAQFVSWLTRLNSTGPDAAAVPEAVRARVRGDYERRLEAVLEQLRNHTTALEAQVQGLTTRHAELANREGELKEQLSEAEIRHMVGEYDEGKWQGIRAELMKVIVAAREELTQTTQEIERLNEVLDTIRSPVAGADEPSPPVQNSAPRPELDAKILRAEQELSVPPENPRAPAASGTTEIPFRSATPKPQPRAVPPKKEDSPGRTLWFPSGKPAESGQGKLDELAFLKSVTGGEGTTAAPKRGSGGFTKPAEPTAPAAAEPPAARQPSPPPPTVDPSKDRGSGQKTLKCAECGTLNRPTEWYCERCGAELAAL